MLCQHTEVQRNGRYNKSRRAKKPLKFSYKNIAQNFTSTAMCNENNKHKIINCSQTLHLVYVCTDDVVKIYMLAF